MRAQYKGGTSALFTLGRWYDVHKITPLNLRVFNDPGHLMSIFKNACYWSVELEPCDVVSSLPAAYIQCLTPESKELYDKHQGLPPPPPLTPTRLTDRERHEQHQRRAEIPPPVEWVKDDRYPGLDVYTTTVPCQPPQTKDLKMKIEDVTLIDGNRADEMNVDWFIAQIKKQEHYIKDLDDIGAKSSKLLAMRKEHKANIDRLVELLDAKE